MVRPNIVIEGKGRNIFQRLISNDNAMDLKNIERKRLDSKKTALKIIPLPQDGEPTVPGEVSFYFVVYNDDQDTSENWVVNLFPVYKDATNWTTELTIDGVVVASGGVFATTPNKVHVGILTMSRDYDDEDPIVESECAFCTIQIYPEDTASTEDNSDVCKCVAAFPLVTLADVDTQLEAMTESEILFPATSTYNRQTVIERYIKQRTHQVTELMLSRLNSITFPFYEPVKALIINRVIKDCYMRAIEFSLDGGMNYMETVRMLKREADELMDQIQVDGDWEW